MVARYLAHFAMVGLYNKFTHKSTYTRICAPSNRCANCYHCGSCHGVPRSSRPTLLRCVATTNPNLPQHQLKINKNLNNRRLRSNQPRLCIMHYALCISVQRTDKPKFNQSQIPKQSFLFTNFIFASFRLLTQTK